MAGADDILRCIPPASLPDRAFTYAIEVVESIAPSIHNDGFLYCWEPT